MKSFILLIALLVAGSGYCQDWYQDGATLPADGIVYKVERMKYTVVLSNKKNVVSNLPNWCYKDGTELKTEEEYDAVDFKMISYEGLFYAFGETFSEEELAPLRLLKKSPFLLAYSAGPDGNMLEVSYILDAIPELMSIPPYKYAMLERKLKSYVKFKVNHYGQKLGFMHGSIFIFFSTIPPISELPPGGFVVKDEFEEELEEDPF